MTTITNKVDTLDMKDKSAVFVEAKKDLEFQRKSHQWDQKSRPNHGGTGGSNVLTGAISVLGIKSVATYPCHAPIRNFRNASVLWSAFGYRGDKAPALEYFSWLVSASPWYKAGIVPKLDKEFMFEQGFIFQDLDQTPGNLLHNFLIASRMAVEWPDQIKAWSKLVYELGVDPSYAFYVLTLWWPVLNNNAQAGPWVSHETVTWSTLDKYDWPLDTFRASTDYPRNFLAGKVSPNKDMFYPNCKTDPVNTLWGPVNLGKGGYIKELETRYKDIFSEKEYTQGTGSYARTHKMVQASKKDILSLVRSEEMKLLDKQLAA